MLCSCEMKFEETCSLDESDIKSSMILNASPMYLAGNKLKILDNITNSTPNASLYLYFIKNLFKYPKLLILLMNKFFSY